MVVVVGGGWWWLLYPFPGAYNQNAIFASGSLFIPMTPLGGIGHHQTVSTLCSPVPLGWHPSKSYFLFLILVREHGLFKLLFGLP